MTRGTPHTHWCWPVLAAVLLQGCWRRTPLEQVLPSPASAEASSLERRSKPKVRSTQPPGQLGPTQELLATLSSASLSLTAQRTQRQRPDGERLWTLELHQKERLLARWEAVSGFASSQSLDRRWSPGNGAPLPSGLYSLGLPEAWGDDIWFTLTPRFETTRSGLGIHGCNPGSGCVCLPDRAALEALAKWAKAVPIQTLTVLN